MANILPTGFSADKARVTALIQTHNCSEIADVQAATSYARLLDLFFQFAGLWDCDLPYMTQVLDIFDDATLLENGIYYNKTAGGTVDNPNAVVNSTFDTININTGGLHGQLEILKGSLVDTIVVSNNTKVFSIAISGGSSVQLLDVRPDGSLVETLLVKACNGANSTLNLVVEGSEIDDIGIDQGSIFHGYTNCNNLTT